MSSEEKKERPVSMICEATNYNLTSDYAAHPMSPVGRTSRSSKKVHNFGKRSNSIKRNLNAPVVRRGWLYKQDSTGMKLWKKRWFVLSDLCLFYYRDEKEEGILGSILLPSFQISVLTAEDHITRKYAFKVRDSALPWIWSEGQQKLTLDGAQLGLRDGAQLSSRDGAQLSPGDGAQLGSEPPRLVHRTSSMLQLEQWIRAQRGRGQDEETRGPVVSCFILHFSILAVQLSGSFTPFYFPQQQTPSPCRESDANEGLLCCSITSYQTLPRNMPSHRAQVLPRYPEGYRTLPRNSKARPDSLCSVAPCYERAAEDKRRSMRDDTMWQLYEWQQRQFYSKQGTLGRHGALGSPKGMASLCEQPLGSIPTSPSHGSLAGFQPFSPQRAFRSELSSPVQRGDVTMERRHRTHHSKHVFVPDRRSMPAALTLQPVTPQSLQGKTPEELTLLLIKLRRQQAELSSIREHTLAQLMQLKLEASSPKMKENEPLITMVHTMIENSALRPQLYHQWILIVAMFAVYLQTESAGIQRAQIQKELWRIQDVMEGLLKHKQQRSSSEAGIMVSRTFSSIKYKNEEEEVVPPRPPLPRSYDFTEHPPIIPPLPSDSSSLLCYSRGPVHLTEEKRMYQVQGYQRNGSYCGPDYRLYKSEPELTTVAEVDESNGEEKTEPVSESESSGKGSHFPVGVVPPRTKSPTPESSTIASYVTLRKNKKIDLRTNRKKEDAVAANMKESESTSRENNLKQNNGSPGEEIEELKNDGDEEHNSSFTEELSKTDDLLSDAHVVSDSKEVSDEEKAEKKNQLEETHDGDISLQSVTTVANHKPKTSSEESEILSVQEQEGIVSSFELAAQSSKGNQAAAVKSLPSSPESSLSPAASTQTQLTEGSHFMCV
ncbi:hypothetical protein Nmel_006183 [Mimus melanotis]